MKPIIALLDSDPITHFILERSKPFFSSYDFNLLYFSSTTQIENYLTKNSSVKEDLPDIILMEIYLFPNDGWSFLDRFNEFSKSLIKVPSIFIVSTSSFSYDRLKAAKYTSVAGFIQKPLTESSFKLIDDQLSVFFQQGIVANK